MNALPGKAGQASVEFVVGLVALLVVSAVLLQVGQITREHLRVMAQAREEAGRDAMAETYSLRRPLPQYLGDWDAGPDGRRYSQDDRPVAANAAVLSSDVIAHARPADLAGWLPGNAVSSLDGNPVPVNEFGLVHRRVATDPIALLPVVRHLVYQADTIELDFDAWLVWTQGIY